VAALAENIIEKSTITKNLICAGIVLIALRPTRLKVTTLCHLKIGQTREKQLFIN
jgi:hypothetical protein